MLNYNDDYKECECCFMNVHINKMIIKETVEGNCIYCPKCVEYHDYLNNEALKLYRIYNINPKNYK